MRTLHGRLLLTATLVMVMFLLAAGFALDNAFRRSAVENTQTRLEALLLGLLAGIDIGPDSAVSLDSVLADSRWYIPGSGLFAWVVGADGVIWRSDSATGLDAPGSGTVDPGARQFARVSLGADTSLFLLEFGVLWEAADATAIPYTFTVAEDVTGYEREVSAFRQQMIVWLAAATVVLLVVQGLVLRWATAPLRRVALEVRDVELGRRPSLSDDYPRELLQLTDNINRFVENEQAHLRRYRHTLDDLAHSLKTPLAVIRGALNGGSVDSDRARELRDQVARMNGIVEYQLRRAATSGPPTMSAPVAVRPHLDKLLATLGKVYADKRIEFEALVPDDMVFRGEEGDLLELLGNLLDNACKHCAGRVRCVGDSTAASGAEAGAFDIAVEDDGPGIPDDLRHDVLSRGVRGAGPNVGQGIGLAVVSDIVTSYGGTLRIDRGDLGGARVGVHIGAA